MKLISCENPELDLRMNMWRESAETFYKSIENAETFYKSIEIAELHSQFGESLSKLSKALKEALNTVAGETFHFELMIMQVPKHFTMFYVFLWGCIGG